ncbi:hypothetical protein SAMN04488528_1003155 [Clostridium frigidicarnis]|uniref:Uncharacterized protein n=1 Tax=Clostridium frigidicarnis TaxID=84698 RepID=A0A1I0VZH9_9CLOT|nr:hypothetical protein SAMN04488528_1003155 [Clostridium frigidicarnis]
MIVFIIGYVLFALFIISLCKSAALADEYYNIMK